MRHELVHRLTRVGHQNPVERLPDRLRLGRVGERTRAACRVGALLALVAVLPMAAALAVLAVGTGLSGLSTPALVGGTALLLAAALGSPLARRLPARRLRWR